MTELLVQLAAVAALTVLATFPGGLVLTAVRAQSVLPAPLVPAAALAITLAALLPALVVTLWLELPITAVAAWWLAVTIAAGVACLRFATQPGFSRAALFVRSSPLGWLKGIDLPVRVLAAASAAIAFVWGGWLDDGDMMYHAAVARKLAELDSPSFESTQLFIDGSAHPGYLAPVWHEMWALTSWLTGIDVLTVLWMAAVPAAVLATLAAAGLAEVALRSRVAGSVAAAVFVIAEGTARPPLYGGILGSASPTGLAVDVLLPAAIACWLLALWHPEPRGRRVAAGVLVAGTVPALMAVHVSYITFLGLIVAGYTLAWLAAGPRRTGALKRHLVTGALLAVVATAGLAAIAPSLSTLSTIDSSTDVAAAQQEFHDFEEILAGDEDSYHLRAHMLAQFGGLALAGVCCLMFGLLRRRDPVGWLLVGGGGLVLLVSQWNPLFMEFSALASVSQTKRLQFALPWELALTMGLLVGGAAIARWWTAGGGRRILAALGGLAASAALFVLAWRVDPLVRLKAESDVPDWPIVATMIVLLAGLVYIASRRSSTGQPGADTVVLPGAGATRVTCLLLAAASIPVLVPFVRHVPDAVTDRPGNALRAYDLADIDPEVITAVRKLRPGSIVAAPPDIALRIAAVAPVYVTWAPARHVAGTKANRREDRLAEARTVYGLGTSPERRVDTALGTNADLLVLERPRGPVRQSIVDAFEASDRFGPAVAAGDGYLLLEPR